MKSKSRSRTKSRKGKSSLTTGPHVPPRNYLSRNVAGVHQKLKETLTWVAFGSASTGPSSFYDQYTIILNGPYSPDASIFGTSATGFAKYMAFYSKCYVHGARVKVRMASLSESGTVIYDTPLITGVTITTNSTALTSVPQAIQTGLCMYEVGCSNPDRYKFEQSVDIAKFVGIDDIMDNSQYFCTSSANPTQIIAAHVWTYGAGGGTVTSTVVLEVEFDVTFTDPIPFT